VSSFCPGSLNNTFLWGPGEEMERSQTCRWCHEHFVAYFAKIRLDVFCSDKFYFSCSSRMSWNSVSTQKCDGFLLLFDSRFFANTRRDLLLTTEHPVAKASTRTLWFSTLTAFRIIFTSHSCLRLRWQNPLKSTNCSGVLSQQTLIKVNKFFKHRKKKRFSSIANVAEYFCSLSMLK